MLEHHPACSLVASGQDQPVLRQLEQLLVPMRPEQLQAQLVYQQVLRWLLHRCRRRLPGGGD
ncbi:hypothetical protein LT85_1023 [Collimonas arenae]|uniref:Uncharacterized protein n=1 Tax=Collimonas arenae TaxID=279058 RepID=A0A0A1F6P4_9BURK|nr:hypothetical protein LT85_1023 [Collimonas arenae]